MTEREKIEEAIKNKVSAEEIIKMIRNPVAVINLQPNTYYWRWSEKINGSNDLYEMPSPSKNFCTSVYTGRDGKIIILK